MSPPTQYRLSGRRFYRSKDPTNSIKVLREKSDWWCVYSGWTGQWASAAWS